MKDDRAVPATLKPKIDLASLPLLELAATLRTLGENLLRELLFGVPRPDGAMLFPPAQARILAVSRSYVPHVVQRWWAKVPRLGSRPQRPDIVRQAITTQLSFPVWHTLVLEQIAPRLGSMPPAYVPDDLWPLVGEIAWRDLLFQRRVAGQVRDYLQHQVLFTQDAPLAVLSPKTFWVLIALAPRETSSRFSRLRRGQWLSRKAVERLGDVGQQQALTPRWAGFWDQWLLAEALRCWPDALEKLDAQLRSALVALPLTPRMLSKAFLAGYGESQRGRRVASTLAALDWAQDEPAWFSSLCIPLHPERQKDRKERRCLILRYLQNWPKIIKRRLKN